MLVRFQEKAEAVSSEVHRFGGKREALSVINNRRLFHSLLRAAYLAQKPFAKEGMIRHLPLFFAGLTEYRSLPAIAEVPFRDIVKKISQPKGGEKVAFFVGCAIDFVYPEIGEAVVKVLNRAGLEVLFPEAQICCGTPARGSGAYDLAAKAAVENIKALFMDDLQYVVTACATCASALKQEFIRVLEAEKMEEWIPKAKELASRVYGFSSLVKKLVDEKRLTLREAKTVEKITYHDSCHAKRFLGIHKEPREVIQRAGHELKEMFEADICCGMAGSYTLKQAEISRQIMKRKIKNIEDTGADAVAVECPGCLMQIKGGLDKAGSKVKAKHVAQVLAANLEDGKL